MLDLKDASESAAVIMSSRVPRGRS